MDSERPQSMKALKGLVIGMGVLIVVALVVVIWTIANRMSGSGDATGPANLAVPLPQGAQVLESNADGNRLYLRLRTPDGGEQIRVIDTRDGQVITTIRLVPEGR